MDSQSNLKLEEHENYLLVNGNKIYLSKELQEIVLKEHKESPSTSSIAQFAAISKIPGCFESIGLPDFHTGYALPIGSVAAIDLEDENAAITPNGVGYDINCGVRFLKTNLTIKDLPEEIREKLGDQLVQELPFDSILKENEMKPKEFNEILTRGMEYLKEIGRTTEKELQRTESRGSLEGNSKLVNQSAKARGQSQLCTLGSGNHYLEIEVVEEIFDERIAKTLGIEKNQIVISIHTGSRGLGHGCCSEIMDEIEKSNIKELSREEELNRLKKAFKEISQEEITKEEKQEKYSKFKKQATIDKKKRLEEMKTRPDLLQNIPFESEIGQKYFKIMNTAANYAWANRTLIAEKVKKVFSKNFKSSEIELISDVCHNIGKVEIIDGKRVLVLRKGASRMLPPFHEDLPEEFKEIGQPVFVGGSMGSSSYLIVGTKKVNETFYSTCHGAGRLISRSKAKKAFTCEEVIDEMKLKGIVFRVGSQEGMVEESAGCYKNVESVIEHVEKIGICKKVCRVRPIFVLKG